MSTRRMKQSQQQQQGRVKVSEEVLIPLLARRSCHLPGNDWREDWVQYQKNNHIVFGICLCHPLHPLEWWERIMALIGSIAVGLIATNIAYLWDAYDHQEMSESLVDVENTDFVVTKGMIFLWTFGAIVHSLYDLIVWHVMACVCCHPGGRWGNTESARFYKDCGSYLLIPVVLGLAGLAGIAVMRRASTKGDAVGDDAVNTDDSILWNEIEGVKSFSFLTKYALELSLTWFVYFPIVSTILFSGIFGCGGRLPVLGGRPRDKRLYEESLENNESGQYSSF